MDPLVLMMVGTVLFMIPIAIFFGLVFLALFIYVWTHIYPWLKMVGKWGARPVNLLSLLLAAGILFFGLIFIWGFLRPLGAPPMLGLLLIAISLLMIGLLAIIMFPVYLALIVWIIRFIKWTFFRWRTWLGGLYYSVRREGIEFKMKTAVIKEGGIRGKMQFGAKGKKQLGFKMKKEVGMKGKKEMGFKEKLDELRAEFLGDVQRARGRMTDKTKKR